MRVAIMRHPFVRGLADGSLGIDRFKFYVVQDAIYLRDFSRALCLTAASAPDEQTMLMLQRHAVEAIEVERQLHDGFIRQFGMHPEQIESTEPAPTNMAYCSYLVATASTRPFHESLGALLPCYWIYWYVGSELERLGSPQALYRRWIDSYAAEQFAAVAQSVIERLEREAVHLDREAKEAVAKHFTQTSKYEWMFWDMAWRMEQWPV